MKSPAPAPSRLWRQDCRASHRSLGALLLLLQKRPPCCSSSSVLITLQFSNSICLHKNICCFFCRRPTMVDFGPIKNAMLNCTDHSWDGSECPGLKVHWSLTVGELSLLPQLHTFSTIPPPLIYVCNIFIIYRELRISLLLSQSARARVCGLRAFIVTTAKHDLHWLEFRVSATHQSTPSLPT